MSTLDTATTIPSALRASVEAHGSREAVVDGDTRLTWRQLGAAVEEVAASLLSAGIESGDRVSIWAPNSWRWIVASLATTMVGAVLVPISSRNVGREVVELADRADVRVMLLDRHFLDKDYLADLRRAAAEAGGSGGNGPVPGLPQLGLVCLLDAAGGGADPDGHDDVVSWESLRARGSGVDRDRVHERADAVTEHDVADIIFTSGTTGSPKGVLCEHGQNLFTYVGWRSRVGLRTDDRYLLVNPLSHSFGYKAGLLACVQQGTTLVTVPSLDVPQVLRLLEEESITVLPGAPALYRSLLEHPERTGPLPSLRMVVTGAADVPVHLIEAMRDELGIPEVLTAYGLSESAGTVTVSRLSDDPETIAFYSGTAIDGVEVRTVDEDGRDVGPDQPGEVLVRGPNVMRGYLDDAESTAEAIDEDGWLHTGDVGIMNADGYLRITDRIKHMLQVGGFNVYPAEVEAVLTSRADIADAAVVGAPDERLGEVPKAFVIVADGHDLDVDELQSWCHEQLANYKVPRSVEIRDRLPRNALGKVLKHELEATGVA